MFLFNIVSAFILFSVTDFGWEVGAKIDCGQCFLRMLIWCLIRPVFAECSPYSDEFVAQFGDLSLIQGGGHADRARRSWCRISGKSAAAPNTHYSLFLPDVGKIIRRALFRVLRRFCVASVTFLLVTWSPAHSSHGNRQYIQSEESFGVKSESFGCLLSFRVA